jgi:phage baseplate assembly protein W
VLNLAEYFSFPFQIDSSGRNVVVDDHEHIRQQMELILFTSPGERLNHPTFGCGINQMMFERNDAETALSAKYLIQSSLQYWMGEDIEIKTVDIQSQDEVLSVIINYLIKQKKESFSATFTNKSN